MRCVQLKRVKRLGLLREAVKVLAHRFGPKRAEDSVPNNQHASVVLVAWGAVVHAVCRGCVEDVLQAKRHPPHHVRVDPVLEEQVELVVRGKGRGWEPHQRDRDVHGPDHERLEGALAEGRGEVVVLAGVVHAVGGPEYVKFVENAVPPVVTQVLEQQERYKGKHGPLLDGNGLQACVPIHNGVHAGRHDDLEAIGEQAAELHEQTCAREKRKHTQRECV